MSMEPRIFIVDDNDALRQSLELLLEAEGFAFQAFISFEQFVENYGQGTPGCLILDYNMAGMDSPELHAKLRRHQIYLPIIFLSSYGNESIVVKAIRAGADDFLIKPVSQRLLIEHIRAILQFETQEKEQGGTECGLDKRLFTLTLREKEILALALSGTSNKHMAQQLGISYRTIENHRRRILKKTGAANFIEIARW
jgi:two-component system, LuxR family, response regulator FixJ